VPPTWADIRMKDLIQIVEPLIPALRRYARALLRDKDLSDDLVQDCLERVISQWQRRRDSEHTRQWIFTIMHNLAISGLRRQARRGPHMPLDDVEESALAVPATQDGQAGHRDLLRALDALPEDQRSVLLLVSVEDLSYAETARVLDIPVGTVMSRLSRGREKLLQAMSAGTGEAASPARLRRIK